MRFFRRWCVALFPLFLCLLAQASPLCLSASLTALTSPTAGTLSAALDAVKASGARQVRLLADWPRVQPRPNVWDFTWLDAAVRLADSRNLTVVLVCGPASRWTVTYLGSAPSAPEVRRAKPDLGAYRTYITTLAQRYQSRVQYYQLWERPTSLTLLAMPSDVYALYRVGAHAVHLVNPSLRVIAAEPGGIDLGWISDYLRSAHGSDRADMLALSPAKYSGPCTAFAWRIQTLRERILPKNDPPALWLDLPVRDSFTTAYAAVSLLEGIDNLTLSLSAPAASGDELAPLHAFAPLQGREYRGWTDEGASGGCCGLFSAGAGSGLLLHPETDGRMAISSVMSNRRAVTPGYADFRPAPIGGTTVSLDISGQDPAGVHPLPNFPGGHYSQYDLHGHTVISTIRGEQPWIYFDIPAGFLFYNTERRPIEVTIQVLGAISKEHTGFNLYYDAVDGMRNTHWQWIDVGPDNVYTYTVRLNDALFADRDGYDLRLNMGGSDENVRVVNVSVTKE